MTEGTPNLASLAPGPSSPSPEVQVARPGLERVDRQPIGLNAPDPELQRRRFCVSVESVYYHAAAGGHVGCAIQLKTFFEFHGEEKLARAVFPLTARTLQAGADATNDNEGIDICNHHPHEVEVIRVGRRKDLKTIFLVPTVKATILGSGLEMSGMGVNTQREHDRTFVVSLRPRLTKLGTDPSCLVWEFEDSNARGVYYPPDMKLLVVVEKPPASSTETWFSFELRLELDLQVDIHNSYKDKLLQPFLRLMARSPPHKGWCFRIKGNFHPELAQAALANSMSEDGELHIPPGIGLNAAASNWLKVMSTA